MKVGVFTEGNWFGKVIGNDEWIEKNLRTVFKKLKEEGKATTLMI